MKNKKLTALTAILMIVLVHLSCKKNQDLTSPPRIHHPVLPVNLISNPGFSLDDSTTLPGDWTPVFEYDHTGDIEINQGIIQWSRNAAGNFIFIQRIKLTPDRLYRVSIDFEYEILNHRPGGLYIFDSSFQNLLGKEERFNSTGSDKLEFVFNSIESEICFVIGFPTGMKGTAKFSNPAVSPYPFMPQPRNTSFSTHLVSSLKLSFDKENFDGSIQSVTNYINKLLLSKRNNIQVNIDYILRIVNKDHYPHFSKSLNELHFIQDAYCQRASLSVGEVLTNEFRIPARQVHMMSSGTGYHQFLEYWNPYLMKWIAIDPYFSAFYHKESSCLTSAEIDPEELENTFKSFGSFAFSNNLGEAIEFWNNCEVLKTTVDDFMSFPFGNKPRFVPHSYSRTIK